MSNVTDQQADGDENTMPVDAPTVELPITTTTPAESPAKDTLTKGILPRAAGVLLCVLWIMGIGLLVAQIVASRQHRPGPGPLAVGAHLAVAVTALLCYRATSRNQGLPRLLGFLIMVAITVALLWYFWWSPAR